jgi:hypothetical protein
MNFDGERRAMECDDSIIACATIKSFLCYLLDKGEEIGYLAG